MGRRRERERVCVCVRGEGELNNSEIFGESSAEKKHMFEDKKG